jgi:mRNA interferase MazF
MKRGDLVTIAPQGDFGKPRPALVIQSDYFEAHPSVTVLPLSSDLKGAPLYRVLVQPSKRNGLSKPSEVMVDKCVTFPRTKVGEPFGHIESTLLLEVERCFAVFLGIAE